MFFGMCFVQVDKSVPAKRDSVSLNLARAYSIIYALTLLIGISVIVDSISPFSDGWQMAVTSSLLLLYAWLVYFLGTRKDDEVMDSQTPSTETTLFRARAASSELTFYQSLCMPDFWILFLAMVAGPGGAFTLMNNIAQASR